MGIDQDDEATWVQLRDRLREIREWAELTDAVGALSILDREREAS